VIFLKPMMLHYLIVFIARSANIARNIEEAKNLRKESALLKEKIRQQNSRKLEDRKLMNDLRQVCIHYYLCDCVCLF
jgi:F0F1-type ATP synthase membrane subunit b/b'